MYHCNRAWTWWRQKRPGSSKLTLDFFIGSTKVWLCYCLSMWVHSNPLMSYAVVTFTSPTVVTPPPVAKSVSFTGYITLLWVRRLEMCLDPYKNWIQVDPVFEFLKLSLCCDVALSSPISLVPPMSAVWVKPGWNPFLVMACFFGEIDFRNNNGRVFHSGLQKTFSGKNLKFDPFMAKS